MLKFMTVSLILLDFLRAIWTNVAFEGIVDYNFINCCFLSNEVLGNYCSRSSANFCLTVSVLLFFAHWSNLSFRSRRES